MLAPPSSISALFHDDGPTGVTVTVTSVPHPAIIGEREEVTGIIPGPKSRGAAGETDDGAVVGSGEVHLGTGTATATGNSFWVATYDEIEEGGDVGSAADFAGVEGKRNAEPQCR